MAEEHEGSNAPAAEAEPRQESKTETNAQVPLEVGLKAVPVSPWNPGEPIAPMGFVRGGGAVRTAAYQRQIDAEFADAERRRDELLAEKKIASVPIDEGGGKMYTNLLADEGEGQLPEAHVLLEFVNNKGEPIYEYGEPLQMVGDIKLTAEQAWPGELMLVFYCPRCKERGMPLDHCALHARQSHRKWYLDAKTAGELYVFVGHGQKEPGRSAGKVMDSERLACPACGWACKIDNNKIWPA